MSRNIITGIVVGLLLFTGIVWVAALRSQTEEVVDVTKQCVVHGKLGMHIHPILRIVINGEEEIIPANVGIPSQECMRPLHTHDSSGTIHIESEKIRDFQLKEFFAIWGKKFDSSCIFEYCNGQAGSVKMLVNGQENVEFENYLVNDKDKIEIRYE